MRLSELWRGLTGFYNDLLPVGLFRVSRTSAIYVFGFGWPASSRRQMEFVKESFICAAPEKVFAFHEQTDALRLLTPPWEKSRVVQTARISEVGSQAIIEANIFGPIKSRWIAEHTEYNPPYSFEDIQIRGPFRSWRHRHLIKPNENGAVLRDEITFEPPLGVVGRLLAGGLIKRRLERLFDYRHDVTRRACEEHFVDPFPL
jgi:ligand-binding SRPBCC domain-containing protein